MGYAKTWWIWDRSEGKREPKMFVGRWFGRNSFKSELRKKSSSDFILRYLTGQLNQQVSWIWKCPACKSRLNYSKHHENYYKFATNEKQLYQLLFSACHQKRKCLEILNSKLRNLFSPEVWNFTLDSTRQTSWILVLAVQCLTCDQ